jgi:hypothetical protein
VLEWADSLHLYLSEQHELRARVEKLEQEKGQ